MKILAFGIAAALSLGGVASAADHLVNGYTRSNGTYVAPHYQTNPNATTSDNYSTRGNVNPYTGQTGTRPDTRPAYGSSQPQPQPAYGAYQPSAGATPMYGAKPAPCRSLYSC